MTDAGPRLRALRPWAKREGMCLAILDLALKCLRTEGDLPQSEGELNRRLYFCLLRATRDLYPNDCVAPVSECNNQPDADDQSRAAREQKRPDFQWIYIDRYEANPTQSSKQFVVECKRLGQPQRADWVFNINYVRNGICRFRDPIWAYAQRFPSGAMVGYCQGMDPTQVLNEVNEEARRNALPDLDQNGAAVVGSKRLKRLQHAFDRPFQVSPFHLHHLWIELPRPAAATA